MAERPQSDAADPATVIGPEREETLRRLRARVLAALRAELRDHALADDLCHEAFRIVLERLARRPLEDPAGLESYLMQTARYLVIQHRRRQHRRRTSTGQQSAIDATADARDHDAELRVAACAEAVRRVLQEMRGPRDREILVRVYLHDQHKEVVCRDLRVSEEHYKRVLHRARERFATLFQRRYGPRDLFCIALF